MALLEGTTGQPSPGIGDAGLVRFSGPDLAGSRARIDGPRQPDPSSGPLPIAHPAADVPDLGEVRASLLSAGPDVDDVLDLVVRHAAGLLDAPARLAEPVDGHLIWTRAFGDDDADLGAVVDTEDTLSGAAWRSGLVQFNSPGLSTRCCGSPRSALAVPIAHAREAAGGRHSSSGHEVFALIVLTADRPGWFDRADVRSMLAMAAAAADRITELHSDIAIGSDPSHPGDGLAEDELEASDDADQLDRGDVEPSDRAGDPAIRSSPAQPVVTTAGAPDPYDFRAAQQSLSQKLLAAGADAFDGWFDQPEATGPDAESMQDAEPMHEAEPLDDDDDDDLQFTDASPPGLTLDDAYLDDTALAADLRTAAASQPSMGWDQSPITPRTPLVVSAITNPDAAPAARAVSTKPVPRLLPSKVARTPTPGLQAPIAPALFQRSESLPDPAPLRPRTRTVTIPAPASAPRRQPSEPLAPESAARIHDVPEQRSRELESPEQLSPEFASPEQESPEQESPEQDSPATETSAAFQFAPLQPAGPGAEPRPTPGRQSASPPITEDPSGSAQAPATSAQAPVELPRIQAAVTPSRSTSSRGAAVPAQPAVVPQPPVVPSRQRKPGMQPVSTLPAAMPAPESMGLWQWDAVTGECVWSSPVSKLLGQAPDAPLDLELLRDAVAPSDQERFDLAVQAVTSGRGVAGAIRLNGSPAPDGTPGEPRTAYAWSEVRRDDNGVLLGAWGGVVDVTAFEHDAAQLRSGLTAQRAAQELAGLATWAWHPDSRELVWSPEMYRLLGVDPDAFTPTLEGWHAFVHPDDVGQARMLDLGAVEDSAHRAERVETFRLIGAGGEIRHVQSWSAVSEDDSAPTVYGATIDVTRQVRDRVMLEHLSITDPVTGLGNRLAYDRRISQLLSQPNQTVTLMLLDLDRFKVVNDSLGHQVGDRLLIEVARRLVALVPEDSVTARMGGDEFVVVPPPGANEDDVRRLAVGVVDALRAPYVLPETGELLVCPASIGIAMSARRRVTGHDLLREADIALYQAKDGGRDRYVIFDEPLRARTHVRARAERRLREALQDGRLVMEYQPVIDFANGRLAGAEGLVRLHDSDDDGGRLISPDLFMDIAEQTGLIVEVDCWVIEAAIKQLAQWSEHSAHAVSEDGDPGELPWLAINLSARSMEHPRVVRRLIEAVKRGEVQRGRLKIELTEHSFIGALPGVEAALRQLVANGIQIGIDDFGTGYSALAYLQNFDLDFMKIDRSFVVSVGDNPRGDAVVTAIVDLAHAHGMRVIAEGVETSRQARRLREIGCDFAQGYHFGRPGSPSRITPG